MGLSKVLRGCYVDTSSVKSETGTLSGEVCEQPRVKEPVTVLVSHLATGRNFFCFFHVFFEWVSRSVRCILHLLN